MIERVEQDDFLTAGVDFTAYLRILRHLPELESPGLQLQERSGIYTEPIRDFWDGLGDLVSSIESSVEESGSRRAALFGERQPDLFELVRNGRDPDFLEGAPLGQVLLYLRGVTGFERFEEGFFAEEFKAGGVIRALKRLQTLCTCGPDHIDNVLRFKPIFESLTVAQFRHWNDWELFDLPEGGEALHVPYPEYHPEVWEWNAVVYMTPFYIDPYREVPGKKGGVPPPRFMGIGKPGRAKPERFFKNAPLEEVRQYMAVCLRGEKWCDGYISSEFERGVVMAAFSRLEVLRAETTVL
ncbi:MAG: DUF6508 domain-containing protein [Fimbriimonas sp.]